MLYDKEPARASKRLIQLIFFGSVFLCIFGLTAAAVFYKFVLYNTPNISVENLSLDKKLLITIPKGASLNEIARILEESGIIENARLFVYAAKFLKSEKNLKAGQYLLPLHVSNQQIIKILQSAAPQSVRLTIPEGKDMRYILRAVRTKLRIDTAQFIRSLTDTLLCRELEIHAPSLYGYLMPNTYFLDPGTDEKDLIRTFVQEFNKFFDDNLKRRADQLHLTPHQIVTLASLIEGETSDDDERYNVSAVYHNRLKKNMLLQADPTIQFIIKDGPRRLFNRDLEIDDVYNTYKYHGLPPGPVTNPGKASILAALYPAHVEYLYLVADGSGKHIFSKTLSEHQKARMQLDRIRKNLK